MTRGSVCDVKSARSKKRDAKGSRFFTFSYPVLALRKQGKGQY